MRTFLLLVGLLLAGCGQPSVSQDESPAANSVEHTHHVDKDPAKRFQAMVEKLAAPEMEGRGLGTAGLKRAEKLVESRFEWSGLRPFFDIFRKAKGGKRFSHNVKIKDPTTGQIYEAKNIAGMIGDKCGRTPPVVIGAHMDHLGLGAENSMEPSKKGIHPGADDNASGVAAMLEASRMLADNRAAMQHGCYIFVAFTGEEIGIAGSSRFVDMLKAARIKPKAMLNLDMVGRMQNKTLILFGADSAKEWKEMIQGPCSRYGLTCPAGGDGYGPGDQMAFFQKGTPVLHFFTGAHVDYHRSSDTAEKIYAEGAILTAQVVADIAARTADPTQPLHYKKASAKPLFGKTKLEESRKRTGAYLGTIPDYAAMTDVGQPSPSPMLGVKLSGARTDSPAEKAGIMPGDFIAGVGDQSGQPIGKPIQTLEDFMAVLSELNPGQNVILIIYRDGKQLTLPATVGRKE